MTGGGPGAGGPGSGGPVGVTQQDVDRQADELLAGAADGEPLDALNAAFVQIAVRSNAMALDVAGTREWMKRALDAGATRDQVHEIVTLVSGSGVHAFFEASRTLLELTEPGERGPLSERQTELWQKYIGDGSYWQTMNEEIPGFLDALNRLSPEAFEAFFRYCAVPWKKNLVPALVKEIASAAMDASPNHRYLPGMRLHLRNALKLGAGRRALRDALDIAAAAPLPFGVL
ncbi:MAG: hypothetical protein JWR01_2408 [Subtercola sp.]|nr:hypothetical protein [Subtercola sp.]